MATSQLVYVTIYQEPKTPHYEVLGVFTSLELGKQAGDKHYKRFHVGRPTWVDEDIGSRAEHDNAAYLVRELELTDY